MATPPQDAPKVACAACGEPNDTGAAFCESCGHNLNAPVPEPAARDPATPSGERALKAVIQADRSYFDRYAADSGLAFPSPPPAPFEALLDRATISIGRRSTSRGIDPDINLGPPFDDPAVSHRHAVLNRGPDGSWTLVDVGSTNGTRIDGEDHVLTPATARSVGAGTRIYVGAWTCITVIAI